MATFNICLLDLHSQDSESIFDGYISEDVDIGGQDHGVHVQQE